MGQELWHGLSALPPAVFLQSNGTAYLLVNAAHIASLGLLIGTIVTLDLRLLGAFRQMPLALLGPLLSRMAACGLLLAMLTGAWLFLVNAVDYAANPVLRIKLGLIALAVLNALWLHRRAWTQERPSPAVRLHGALSLLLWPSVLVAGRWIGFV
ncbi:MAG TPA: DUF2214 domain-containing protein [Pseudomonas sp.]|nr:DUF2214 domain-containing protein [Pseudomonas sp.]